LENVMPEDSEQTNPTVDENAAAGDAAPVTQELASAADTIPDPPDVAQVAERLAASAMSAVNLTAAAQQSPHPGHALIDEIQSNLQVQYNPGWLKKKLDELRKLL